ncbi:MAG TPA: aconitate hydratase AcnA [Phycisphaerae bacterium]|nr:aconitate hydratase AcnA [Phycisphaerae bacterium]
MTGNRDLFGARAGLRTRGGQVEIYRLSALERAGFGQLQHLPYSIRILLESVLRNLDGLATLESHVRALAHWTPASTGQHDIPFMPARVVLQDFTGVPALVDLAAMRSAMDRAGGDPRQINPQIPADLVIDHSVQVDYFSRADALALNAKLEFERNRERYELLRWGQRAFDNFRVVPPATGIVHQVNLEYLAKVVLQREQDGQVAAFPDTLVGTDSHTTMINGLGVLGWGVGGIEAEAAMLGQPMFMLLPKVVGFRLKGELPPGTTATDLVLRVTEMLRRFGVVGKFVEFFGPGLSNMPIADRATIGNMAPEYGATVGFFPVDDQTLSYMRFTGRSEDEVDLVERYCKEQGLFRTATSPEPRYSQLLELDLSTVEPSLAGPRRPQDRIALSAMKSGWRECLASVFGKDGSTAASEAPRVSMAGQKFSLGHGAVVIAAVTSCTNTSNPALMLAAGLLAKKAVERGLRVPPWVKTSLAPGSRVVTDYYAKGGLTQYLDMLGFQTVGYGCTTCIGNSGPLPEEIANAVTAGDLVVASVLSGNRNFEARIHPLVRANYLASPPLVIAYALAGTVDIDLTRDPLGHDGDRKPVYLRDIWPSEQEIQDAVAQFVTPEMFKQRYADVFSGDNQWRGLRIPDSQVYEWREDSTYIQEPPFFADFSPQPPRVQPLERARCLVLLGDSVTTDHISPAGSISPKSPAGRYLLEHGVRVEEFNSYGSRRGNDRVMTRGTFANVRLKNLLVLGTEGGVTVHLPSGQQMSIYDAAMRYREEGTPLLVLAGADYGMGSSRDWAAKGTYLLGVRAVIATSFERIHRTNLVCMGVLPLEFQPGETHQSLGLTGHEVFDIPGLAETLKPQQRLTVKAVHPTTGRRTEFATICRIDTPVEMEYYRNGGVLHMVLRRMLAQSGAAAHPAPTVTAQHV